MKRTTLALCMIASVVVTLGAATAEAYSWEKFVNVTRSGVGACGITHPTTDRYTDTDLTLMLNSLPRTMVLHISDPVLLGLRLKRNKDDLSTTFSVMIAFELDKATSKLQLQGTYKEITTTRVEIPLTSAALASLRSANSVRFSIITEEKKEVKTQEFPLEGSSKAISFLSECVKLVEALREQIAKQD